ncbi:MAG: hypothetical protein KF725_07260 [Cyclobacteriaceae bacterium]|nr:hypothetical protein [Cyclobacteriaceae bacterium]UYN88277.1 MAG: hypothetical protein KIT51_08545 [Cyclobacteriaceae bacterium]
MKFWKVLSNLGVSDKVDHYLHRSIILSNRISLVLFILTSIIIISLTLLVGFTVGIQRILYILILFSIIPLLNRAGFYIISRLVISTIVPIYIVGLIAASSAEATPLLNATSYFPSRIIALATCIMPMFVFDTLKEKRWMFLALFICMACVLGFDFIIELFGREVEMYRRKDLFIYYNIIFTVNFLMVTSASYMLKRSVDKSDNENFKLLQEKDAINKQLSEQNLKLQQLNNEIETQNEEMVSQAEELHTNQEKLEEAYQVIQNQKQQLHLHNEHLEDLVAKKNKELIDTNEELSKYNNELRQFSYTISHNLRAPVARLIGLENLLFLKSEGMTEEQRELLDLLKKSSLELDVIIKDLNKIIDIRNDIYKIKEKVSFEQEFDRVRQGLEHQFPQGTSINADFSKAPFIYTIRPMLNSILFNLMSNAIKYRAHTRNLELSINTQSDHECVTLKFSDNGLGMNLDQFGKDLFTMYKRFHTHTDGKGLGLYLVKSQVDAMGGKISVTSELNRGTTFTLEFAKPDDVEGQICYDSEYGQIYYNARLNTAGIRWKKQVISEAYRELFLKSQDVLRTYNTPYWISDLRKQGSIKQEDQMWMVTTIIPESVRIGLTWIVGIYDPAQHNEDYRERIKAAIEKAGALVHFCTETKEAEAWINARIKELDQN